MHRVLSKSKRITIEISWQFGQFFPLQREQPCVCLLIFGRPSFKSFWHFNSESSLKRVQGPSRS